MIEIDRHISERINIETVESVYEEWKRRGFLDDSIKFFESLTQGASEPLIHSFITHVHKEKSLFIDIIGERFDIPQKLRKPLALSADILWAMSLMLDDIQDDDTTRGGMATSWAKFGLERTTLSLKESFLSLRDTLTGSFGNPDVADVMLSFVDMAVKSLAYHRQMNLETPIGVIIRNYEQRCDFHGVFQSYIIFNRVLEGKYSMEGCRIIAGLRHFYRGGQLINDLKDVVRGDVYNRSYSDLRNGTPTVPLVELYNSMGDENARKLKRIFGRRDLGNKEMADFGRWVEDSNVIEKVSRRIKDSYTAGVDLIGSVLADDAIMWFQRWAEYKLGFLKEVLT